MKEGGCSEPDRSRSRSPGWKEGAPCHRLGESPGPGGRPPAQPPENNPQAVSWTEWPAGRSSLCPRHLCPEQPGAGGTRAVDALCSTPRLLDSTLYPLPSGHPRSPSFLRANHAARAGHQWPQAPPSSPSPQQKDPTEEVRVNTLPLVLPLPRLLQPHSQVLQDWDGGPESRKPSSADQQQPCTAPAPGRAPPPPPSRHQVSPFGAAQLDLCPCRRTSSASAAEGPGGDGGPGLLPTVGVP